MECLSKLSLDVLNENNSSSDKNYAFKKMKSRAGKYANTILDHDRIIISGRGYDIDNYLISENVTMQKLMDTYFNYVSISFPYDGKYSGLLFSETHLCNQMLFNGCFFYELYKREIKKLKDEIDNPNLSNEDRNSLLFFISSLYNHESSIIDELAKTTINHNIEDYNEAYRILSKDDTKIYFREYYSGAIDYAFQLNNPLTKFYINAIISIDEFTLLNQKLKLLKESKSKKLVRYNYSELKKTYKR